MILFHFFYLEYTSEIYKYFHYLLISNCLEKLNLEYLSLKVIYKCFYHEQKLKPHFFLIIQQKNQILLKLNF